MIGSEISRVFDKRRIYRDVAAKRRFAIAINESKRTRVNHLPKYRSAEFAVKGAEKGVFFQSLPRVITAIPRRAVLQYGAKAEILTPVCSGCCRYCINSPL